MRTRPDKQESREIQCQRRAFIGMLVQIVERIPIRRFFDDVMDVVDLPLLLDEARDYVRTGEGGPPFAHAPGDALWAHVGASQPVYSLLSGFVERTGVTAFSRIRDICDQQLHFLDLPSAGAVAVWHQLVDVQRELIRVEVDVDVVGRGFDLSPSELESIHAIRAATLAGHSEIVKTLAEMFRDQVNTEPTPLEMFTLEGSPYR